MNHVVGICAYSDSHLNPTVLIYMYALLLITLSQAHVITITFK